MAREYGFTQQEKDTYYLGKRVYSSWGRDDDNDYIAAFVYSVPGDVLLKTLYIPREDVSFSNEGFIDINIGQHLRNFGYTDGEYRVVYKFLRRVAGVDAEVFVDDEGNQWLDEVETKEINGETKYYTSSPQPGIDEQDTTLKKELFIKDAKYFIDGISPDRTEVLVEVDENIQNEEMREDFQTMGRTIEYKSIKTDEQGGIKFDQKNPYILEFEIDEEDRGFTQNMVGGELIIPNLYKLDGFEELDNDDAIVDEIDEPDWSPFPDDSPPPPDLPDEPFEELEVEVGDPLSPDVGLGGFS
jgi:hypothetical protein